VNSDPELLAHTALFILKGNHSKGPEQKYEPIAIMIAFELRSKTHGCTSDSGISQQQGLPSDQCSTKVLAQRRTGFRSFKAHSSCDVPGLIGLQLARVLCRPLQVQPTHSNSDERSQQQALSTVGAQRELSLPKHCSELSPKHCSIPTFCSSTVRGSSASGVAAQHVQRPSNDSKQER
jgi:hypothetical protein